MADSRKKRQLNQTPAAAERRARGFVPPGTITLPAMLQSNTDVAFRETLYLMVLAFSRMQSMREAFGRALSLTASQFIVLIGAAYRQGSEGVTIRGLADHTQIATTHVTTEVGRLIDKGLLAKSANTRDRRSVLVDAPTIAVPLIPVAVKRTMPSADRSGMGAWASGPPTAVRVTR